MGSLSSPSWVKTTLKTSSCVTPIPACTPKCGPFRGYDGEHHGFSGDGISQETPPAPAGVHLGGGWGLPAFPWPPTPPPHPACNENKLVPGCDAGGGGEEGGGEEGEGGGSVPAGCRKGLEVCGTDPVFPAPSCRLRARSPARILGMGSAMGTWLLLLVLLVAAPAQAAAPRQRPVLPDTAGSGDGDEASATLPAQPVTPQISPTVGDMPGTTVTNSSAPGVLDGLVDFFKEYLLLVVVVGSLSFVLLFIICAAVIVRQKHKASAYYPSSFPKKKYVDVRDKSGGERAFSEVPDRAPEAGAEEPLDGSRQLQADILAAAQNLKSPHKAPLANGAQGEQNSPQEEEKEEEEKEGKKLGDEQPKSPAQNPGTEEAGSAGSKETPGASQDGCQAPSGM
ncbi:transmembrane protein 119 [Sylvia atricapilla]|uniref:transmembrane protein 119 n=1 Tax=Sylvia atricapilla TaxID=48155 RepID=UPI003396C725